MAIKTKGGYKCGYCEKFYTDPIEAENCKTSHNLIYVALSKEDLNRLLMYIYTKEDAVLDDRIVETLQKYLKGSFSQVK